MPADTLSPKTPKAAKAKPLRSPNEAIADESLTTLQQTGETFSHVGAECLSIASGNIAAVVETGTLTSQFMSQLGKSCVEACNASMQGVSDISRDAVACRTSADLMDLQKRYIDLFNARASANRKLWSDLFDTYAKACEPLITCAAFVPERLFKAVAD